VAGYQVRVSRRYKPREYRNVYELEEPSVSIEAEEGDIIVVDVRAFDAARNYGEFSQPSELIFFARAAGSPPAEPPPSEPPPSEPPPSEPPPSEPPPSEPPPPGIAVRFDYDGDGRADILWSHLATGRALLWQMGGSRRVGIDTVDVVPVEWQVAFSGDFDGDGRADLVWRDRSAGKNDVWLMDGPDVLEDAALPALPADWLPVGAGDFDGDGREDLLWEQTASGDLELWLMNGIQPHDVSASIAGPGGDWYASCVADFDGDGRADILYREVEAGENQVWRMDGSEVIGVEAARDVPEDWFVTGCGDYDGDGRADILWRHAKGLGSYGWTEDLALWLMDGHIQVDSSLLGSAGRDWQVVASGDYDGDGKLEILWRNDRSGENQLWLTDGRDVLQVSTVPTAWQPYWKLASRDWYDADRRRETWIPFWER
jgi:hypothetical protein